MENVHLRTPPAIWLGPHPGLRPLTMAALESDENWQDRQAPSTQNVLVFGADKINGLGEMILMPGWFRWQLQEFCTSAGSASIRRCSKACAARNLHDRLPLQ